MARLRESRLSGRRPLRGRAEVVPRDAGFVEAANRPAIVDRERRRVPVPRRGPAARVESGARGIGDAGEVIGAAAQAHAPDPAFLVGALRQDPVALARVAHQADRVAAQLDARHREEAADVALGVAEVGPVRAGGVGRERQVEGEPVLERRDRTAPPAQADGLERHRRRVAKARVLGAGLDPVAVDLPADEAAAEAAFLFRQLEGDRLAVAPRGDGEAADVGAPAVGIADQDQRAADIRAETEGRGPQAREITGRVSGRLGDGGDGRSGECQNHGQACSHDG